MRTQVMNLWILNTIAKFEWLIGRGLHVHLDPKNSGFGALFHYLWIIKGYSEDSLAFVFHLIMR